MIKIGNKPIDTLYVGSKLVQQMYLGNKKIYPEEGVIPKQIKDAMVLWYDLKRQGATNESVAANPKLIDLSGNGHDATCYNFAWSGMSGIGGYNFDTLTTWYKSTYNDGEYTVSNTKVHITKTSNNAQNYYYINNNKTVENNNFIDNYTEHSITFKPFKIKISGLPEGYNVNLQLLLSSTEGVNETNNDIILGNGEHEVASRTLNFESVISSATNCHFPRVHTNNMPQIDCDITIEFLPEYPNALVSDGVDDYCMTENVPILTDYTVIAKRKYIDKSKPSCFASKAYIIGQGAFIMEVQNYENTGFQVFNFGAENIATVTDDEIVYITSNSYNGNPINKGESGDGDILWIGKIRNTEGDPRNMNGALYSFLLFNRTLTEEEIEWVKTNLIES